MNIGLFGGSFDPVHTGHVRLVEAARKYCLLDKTVIIPAACSPFKDRSYSSDEDRLELCRLGFPEYCEISDCEIKKGGKSYTVETVRLFRKLYPGAKLYLILGEDQLLMFDKWYRYKEILKKASLCAAVRTDAGKRDGLEEFAEKNLRQYGEVCVMEFEPFDISSTEIRRRAARGEPIDGLVPDAALKYILEKGLYRDI